MENKRGSLLESFLDVLFLVSGLVSGLHDVGRETFASQRP